MCASEVRKMFADHGNSLRDLQLLVDGDAFGQSDWQAMRCYSFSAGAVVHTDAIDYCPSPASGRTQASD